MALDRDGNLWTFGSNNYGQLGLAGINNKCTEPTQITKSRSQGAISDFACGEEHAAYIDSHGSVHTWGYGLDG